MLLRLDYIFSFLYVWVIDREVKMTGYWPSSFYTCLWAETESRSIKTQRAYCMEKEHYFLAC